MTDRDAIDLSNGLLDFALDTRDGLRAARHGRVGHGSWQEPGAANPVFAVHCDGKRLDGQTAGLVVQRTDATELDDGSKHVAVHMIYPADQIEIEQHTIAYSDSALTEQWLVVRNAGSTSTRIERLDSIVLDIPGGEYELRYFTADWGLEFEEIREPLTAGKILETRTGRSSKGQHPWFALVRPNGETLAASAMWSGNWVFRFEGRDDGGYAISGGLHDWEFFKDLAPGEAVESPRVATALGVRADLNDVSSRFARVGRRHWYPQNTLSQRLPVEWNHWWSYVDKFITEGVFKQNVDEAARLGLDVCTLDAGWFGPEDPASHWYDYRGDWDLVNTVRFPSGIRALADYTHERGLAFGLWCEIEGLGQSAQLAIDHPDYVALRDGERLGYVCFGNPAVQEWAFATLDRLVTDYDLNWIKLDFNLDPGAGCNRVDHGHGAGDGLYEHYRGYYRVLERMRERHPEVVLESCSSGGLRIDLGLLRHTHLTFLSDPDWPEHDLQLFWGASTMLAPEVCLHWGFCEWGDTKHPKQTFNPRDSNLTRDQLDYFIRNGMLGAFGYSLKLPELPEWVADRVAWHARMYDDSVSRFVRSGDLLRLTEQPRREGLGDRWAGFQYAVPDGSEHLLFVFRLDGGEPERTLRLQGLDPEREYEVTALTAETVARWHGADLMEGGLTFTALPEEGSEILLIR